MKTSKWVAVGAVAVSFAWLLAGGCSSGDAAPSGDNGASGSGGSKSDLPDGSMVMPDAAIPEGGTTSNIHPLCGLGECLPDSPKSCRGYEPPSNGGADQGGAPSGGQGGQSGGQSGAHDGGEGGAAAGAGSAGESTGGMSGAGAGGVASGGAGASGAGAGGGAGEGGLGGQGGPGEPSLYSCQIVRQNNQPFRQCELAGSGNEDAPCFSSADCAAGLACVTEGDAGRCLFYCCSLDGECGPGTYCAERQQRKDSSQDNAVEPAPVPVCVPADACSLEEEYPCPAGKDCRCKGDTACMVVRDGTTTCLEPGAGLQGDVCPCAWNHLCSSVTNECVKICHIDPTKAQADCGTQKCQASAELPPNFGVCVGPVQ